MAGHSSFHQRRAEAKELLQLCKVALKLPNSTGEDGEAFYRCTRHYEWGKAEVSVVLVL